MKQSTAIGAINVLILPLVLVIVLLLATSGFAAWAYSGRQDYKTNSDQKVAVAVKAARQDESVVKDKAYAEAEKQPLKTYRGPDQYGGVQLSYPKTWSGYVVTGSNSSQPLDGYFQPGIVPSVSDQDSSFALRLQVVNQAYSSVVTSMNPQVVSKTLTAAPYAFPKVPSAIGIRYDGVIDQAKKTNGTMIIVPLRDKTIKVWTESPVYANDFNNQVLPNFSFSP